MRNLKTFGWVLIATGEILQHGVRNGQPRQGWGRPVWEDVSAAKGEKTPPEYVGKGLWEEWEHDAEIDTATHKLSAPTWVVRADLKRLVKTRTAVALSQAEIDARDDAATAAAAAVLDDREAELLAQVSVQAEQARMRFLTAGTGKSNEYEAKREEVERYLAAKADAHPGKPPYTQALWPWAYAEAFAINGDQNPSALQIETAIERFEANAVLWEAIGQRIGALEVARKELIRTARAANDAAAMEAAAVVAWPIPGGGQ